MCGHKWSSKGNNYLSFSVHFSGLIPQRDKLSLSAGPSYKACNWHLCCEYDMIFRQQKFLPPSPMSTPAVCCKNHGAVEKSLCRIRLKSPWPLQKLWQQSWCIKTHSQAVFLSRDILDDKWLPASIHRCICHKSYHLAPRSKLNIHSIMHYPFHVGRVPML